MKRFFSPDNFAMKALTLFCDWMFMTWIYIVFSLPIITIGASTTAMYSLIFKKLNKLEAPMVKTFAHEFKANFKKATLFWIPYLLIEVFLVADVYIAHNLIGENLKFFQYPAAILAFLIFSGTIFVFPQIAKFESPMKTIIKNSLLLSISNIPTVILIIVTLLVPALLATLSPKATFIVLSCMIFFGFGFLFYIYSLYINRIFNKILKVGEFSENPEEESEEIEE